MTIYNASGVICQLGNFCFECMALYVHLSAFKYSKYSYFWQWKWEWEEWE